MNLIPGPQIFPQDEVDFFEPKNEIKSRSEKKKVLLYFVGGVTFAEIAAIRFLNEQNNTPFKFCIATTQIISGNKAVNQMRSAVVNSQTLDPLSIIQK